MWIFSRLEIRVLVLFFAFAGATAQGATIDLGAYLRPLIDEMKNSVAYSKNYVIADRMIRQLREHDTVIFSDGQSYVLDQRVSPGPTTAIWSIKDDPTFLIRIPRPDLALYNFHVMAKFLAGWKRLTELKLPVVRILDPLNESLEYQLVERLNLKFTFYQWVENYEDPKRYRNKISKIDFRNALEQLKTFAAISSHMAELGDGLQMGYDGVGWKIFDFISDNKTILDADYTVWDRDILPKDLVQTLREITMSKRNELMQILASKRCASGHLRKTK